MFYSASSPPPNPSFSLAMDAYAHTNGPDPSSSSTMMLIGEAAHNEAAAEYAPSKNRSGRGGYAPKSQMMMMAEASSSSYGTEDDNAERGPTSHYYQGALNLFLKLLFYACIICQVILWRQYGRR